MKYEKIFKKVARISLAVFFVVLAVLLVYMNITEEDAVIPTPLGIVFFISLAVVAICIIIAFVLSRIEEWKISRYSSLTNVLLYIAALTIVLILYDKFINKEEINAIKSFVQAMVLALGFKGGEYIFDK